MTEFTEHQEEQTIEQMMEFFKEKVRGGYMFSLFKAILELSDKGEGSQELKKDVLNEMMEYFGKAIQEIIYCRTCHNSYQFHFCDNPILREDGNGYAKELNCRECHDMYTISEFKPYLTYFNFDVIRKVRNLQKWGKGLSVNYTRGNLNHPAMLVTNTRESVLWIEGYLVRNSQTVEKFWKLSKQILAGNLEDEGQVTVSVEDGHKVYYFLKEQQLPGMDIIMAAGDYGLRCAPIT